MSEAAMACKQALARNRRHAGAMNLLGCIHLQRGDLAAAEALFRQAIGLKDDAGFLSNLGSLLRRTGRPGEAEPSLRGALQLDPHNAGVSRNLAHVLQDLGRLEEAEAILRDLSTRCPNDPATLQSLGFLLLSAKRLESAQSVFRTWLDLDPTNALAWINLGAVLVEARRSDEAETAFRQALVEQPHHVHALYNLGVLLRKTQRLEAAAATFEQVLRVQPDHAAARVSLSYVFLGMGRFAEAWPLHEHRQPGESWKARSPKHQDRCPIWVGEPLADRSIAIWAEQGFGDTIQFARYLPLLKTAGARQVFVVCPSAVAPLLESVEAVDAVFTTVDGLPRHDFCALLMSLPLRLHAEERAPLATLPYLTASPALADRWTSRLPEAPFRVGLVWQGSATHTNDADRSLPGLAALAPLWSVADVAFISLQMGPASPEDEEWVRSRALTCLGGEIETFADTAAIVSRLDLVISVDTSIVHVAGALGKPCWVLLPVYGLDWRWLRDRSDSPWYPQCLRLFRQTVRGDWGPVIDEVAAALALLRS